MNLPNFRGTLLLIFMSVMTTSVLGQTKPPAGANQPFNIYKEVLDHKGQLQWRPAPSPGIPPDVCVMLKVCEDSAAPKLVTLPRTTEGGQPVGRGLLLSRSKDPKNPDAVLLEHQTVSDLYYFLVSPEGNLQKVAYIQQGSSNWMPIAASLAAPVFEKDRQAWHDLLQKLGAAGK